MSTLQPQFLSFRTPVAPSDAEWSATGDALRRGLADALERRGFSIDLEAGDRDPDWYFVARRGSDVFGVALVLGAIGHHRPCCWSIGLEDSDHRNLTSDVLRAEINPVLEAVVVAWPGT